MTATSRLSRLFAAPRRAAGLILAALTLAVATPQASAQFGMMGMGSEMGEVMKPATNPRLLKAYAEILSLSPEQKRAADELLIGYQGEFRAATSRLEDIFRSMGEEMQETGEYETYQEVVPSLMIKFMKRADALNATFMNDLKSLLEPRQLDLFPSVERLQRRQPSMKMGLEGVQTLDLIDVVDGLRLEPAAASGVAATSEQYAVELDKELVSRDKMMRGFLEQMQKFMEEGKSFEEDPEMFTKAMTDMAESGDRFADVNNKYIPLFRAALPENMQGEFDMRIKMAKYPAIYKKSYATRVFDALEKLPDLDAGQKEGIKTIKESYLRDAATANDKWAAVLEELKSAQGAQGAMMGGGMWMIRSNEKYMEAQTARKDLDDKTVEAVKALLNDAQRTKIPRKSYRAEWDFDRASE